MNIPTAINILERKLNSAQFWNDPTMAKAIELGIQALKHLKEMRELKIFRVGILLPGETEE